ncbi:hypothetical protein R1flu_006444 [Riccia fluitans]|uniref:Uncharacterized protein n=1 Tax=Riccia fluitans TaxID=41844 RepID=A0ABD1YWD5_9MARC
MTDRRCSKSHCTSLIRTLSSAGCSSEQLSENFYDAKCPQPCNVLLGFRNAGFWSRKQILHDDYGRTLATLEQSTDRRLLKWNVYRGKKPHKDAEDLLFTMGDPKVKRKKSFDIWLAGKEEPDFSLDAVYSKEYNSQIIHRGSEMVLAEVKEKWYFFKPNDIIVKT